MSRTPAGQSLHDRSSVSRRERSPPAILVPRNPIPHTYLFFRRLCPPEKSGRIDATKVHFNTEPRLYLILLAERNSFFRCRRFPKQVFGRPTQRQYTTTLRKNPHMPNKKPEQSGKHWTKDEIECLTRLAKGNTPTRVIALKLGRSPQAVYGKASKLRSSLNPPNQSPYNRKKS